MKMNKRFIFLALFSALSLQTVCYSMLDVKKVVARKDARRAQWAKRIEQDKAVSSLSSSQGVVKSFMNDFLSQDLSREIDLSEEGLMSLPVSYMPPRLQIKRREDKGKKEKYYNLLLLALFNSKNHEKPTEGSVLDAQNLPEDNSDAFFLEKVKLIRDNLGFIGAKLQEIYKEEDPIRFRTLFQQMIPAIKSINENSSFLSSAFHDLSSDLLKERYRLLRDNLLSELKFKVTDVAKVQKTIRDSLAEQKRQDFIKKIKEIEDSLAVVTEKQKGFVENLSIDKALMLLDTINNFMVRVMDLFMKLDLEGCHDGLVSDVKISLEPRIHYTKNRSEVYQLQLQKIIADALEKSKRPNIKLQERLRNELFVGTRDLWQTYFTIPNS